MSAFNSACSLGNTTPVPFYPFREDVELFRAAASQQFEGDHLFFTYVAVNSFRLAAVVTRLPSPPTD